MDFETKYICSGVLCLGRLKKESRERDRAVRKRGRREGAERRSRIRDVDEAEIAAITRRPDYTCEKTTLDLNYPSFMVILNNTDTTSSTFKRVLTNVIDSNSRVSVSSPHAPSHTPTSSSRRSLSSRRFLSSRIPLFSSLSHLASPESPIPSLRSLYAVHFSLLSQIYPPLSRLSTDVLELEVKLNKIKAAVCCEQDYEGFDQWRMLQCSYSSPPPTHYLRYMWDETTEEE
ncbi:hypothetical protein Sjap_009604 [Stephania japonica]|uniref:Subtilisin-like protease fibronectin type-III domain-containing protein n=1 Tax=Stephania japonica TaxID=461633 RepID=A0AAP0J7E6_9MAGN